MSNYRPFHTLKHTQKQTGACSRHCLCVFLGVSVFLAVDGARCETMRSWAILSQGLSDGGQLHKCCRQRWYRDSWMFDWSITPPHPAIFTLQIFDLIRHVPLKGLLFLPVGMVPGHNPQCCCLSAGLLLGKALFSFLFRTARVQHRFRWVEVGNWYSVIPTFLFLRCSEDKNLAIHLCVSAVSAHAAEPGYLAVRENKKKAGTLL